jgi:hypothetical protein
MGSAKEYRENADDCLVWAKTVTSDHARAIFLDMARNWLEAASRAEGRKITYKLRAKRLQQISASYRHDAGQGVEYRPKRRAAESSF